MRWRTLPEAVAPAPEHLALILESVQEIDAMREKSKPISTSRFTTGAAVAPVAFEGQGCVTITSS